MKWNTCVKSLEFGGGVVAQAEGVEFLWNSLGLFSLIVWREDEGRRTEWGERYHDFHVVVESATLKTVGTYGVIAIGYVREIGVGYVPGLHYGGPMKGYTPGLAEIELWVEEED